MAYNAENYKKVTEAYAERRQKAIAEADMHRAHLHAVSPEAVELDHALSQVGLRIFKTGCLGGEELPKRLVALQREHEGILAARVQLLQSLGLPEDYTEVHYTCPDCMDTGYIDTKICPCMKKALIYEGFRSSGLGKLVERQSFENFSLAYATDAERPMLEQNLAFAKAYAEGFSTDSGNILMLGGTGLGKTHLSTAIAKTVIEGGHDVYYETAQNMIFDFEQERFHSGYGTERNARTEKYFSAELLILDDLGTEVVNAFSVACLYNVLNTRINQGMPTVISTNLEQELLRKKYDDRITSRLLGEFRIMLFRGRDVRNARLGI